MLLLSQARSVPALGFLVKQPDPVLLDRIRGEAVLALGKNLYFITEADYQVEQTVCVIIRGINLWYPVSQH